MLINEEKIERVCILYVPSIWLFGLAACWAGTTGGCKIKGLPLSFGEFYSPVRVFLTTPLCTQGFQRVPTEVREEEGRRKVWGRRGIEEDAATYRGQQGLACVSRAGAGYEQRLWKGISLRRPKSGFVPNPALRPAEGTFLGGGLTCDVLRAALAGRTAVGCAPSRGLGFAGVPFIYLIFHPRGTTDIFSSLVAWREPSGGRDDFCRRRQPPWLRKKGLKKGVKLEERGKVYKRGWKKV